MRWLPDVIKWDKFLPASCHSVHSMEWPSDVVMSRMNRKKKLFKRRNSKRFEQIGAVFGHFCEIDEKSVIIKIIPKIEGGSNDTFWGGPAEKS